MNLRQLQTLIRQALQQPGKPVGEIAFAATSGKQDRAVFYEGCDHLQTAPTLANLALADNISGTPPRPVHMEAFERF